jgi:D-3-phosphoglycerate dehydrogenase / 2-oxoglutarate reductase
VKRGAREPAIREVFLVQPIHESGIERLRSVGIAVRQATAPEMQTVAEEIGAAQAAVTRNAGLDATAMDAAPALRLVVVHGVGYDRVDVSHATTRGIVVCNTPAGNAGSVAEHTLAFMLALARQLLPADRLVRAGRFNDKYTLRIEDLAGKTLGIVGCGRVGLKTAVLARNALRMRILGYSPRADPARLRRLRIEPCPDLERLLEAADVVSLHAALRPDTRGLLGRAQLARMHRGAWLINTARGALVDEAALVEALRTHHLAGAALDVFADEPLPAGHPLLGLDNVLLSPHIAGSSEQALAGTAGDVVRAVLRMSGGRRPVNLLNPIVFAGGQSE